MVAGRPQIALTIMGKAQRRVLDRPPLTLIAAPGASAKAVDWMVARGARQVVPAVGGFTPGYTATRLATFDPSGAHGCLLYLSSSSRLRLRRASVKGRLRTPPCSGRLAVPDLRNSRGCSDAADLEAASARTALRTRGAPYRDPGSQVRDHGGSDVKAN